MELKEVESSNIYKIGYDKESKLLQIVFLNNDKVAYEYKNVPEEVYTELINAESIGSTFHRIIRDLYEFTKVTI